MLNNDSRKDKVTKRNTIQKEVVARIVKEACNHPTANMVLAEAKKELPNLSLGTVYRILNDMSKEGEIREVTCKDLPSRFDKTTMEHGHFQCVKCGKVVDIIFNLDKIDESIVDFDDNEVLESQLFFRGICKDCKGKK
ncbi:MAG TPA: transcriptional repressor [Clostridiales bacterium]|nr:transcriptional repressor [Clostridiales bacterium]HCH92970.1 transcriptional repressor [Clostridiales bacterium]